MEFERSEDHIMNPRTSAFFISLLQSYTADLTFALDRHESMISQANAECSLGLVFFDIIYLNSEPLHAQPYSQRGEIVDDSIFQEPGKTILADRYLIKMTAEEPELRTGSHRRPAGRSSVECRRV